MKTKIQQTIPRYTWRGLLSAIALGLPLLAAGQVVRYDSAPGSVSVPDFDPFQGASSTISVTDSSLIGKVEVEVTISGGYNGDLYMTLGHDSGFSVLLNRVGRNASSGLNSFGYSDSGFSHVTFSDDAANGDVHVYRATLSGSSPGSALGGSLTGAWAPDGRSASSDQVLTSSDRNSFLGSFRNLDAEGDWTLSLSDWAPSESSTLVGWSLLVTPVPEPAEVAFVVGLGLLVFAVAHRKASVKRTWK